VTEGNLELARRGYEAVRRGDFAAIRELFDPNVRWHGGDPDADYACKNRQQALAFMRQARTRNRPLGEPVDMIEAGDKIVVILRRIGEDGEPELVANLTTFRDGKVVEMVHFQNPEDALAAAGV
jgi:ketosteroid isomerase-like protein